QTLQPFDDAIFIEIFHDWIRHNTLPGVLLDVADYRHVPHASAIILFTHDTNFAIDYAGGRFGLLAQRKRGAGLDHQERILNLIQATAYFGTLLEADHRLAGKLQFDGGTFHYISNDRLQQPNTAPAFSALQADLQGVSSIIYPQQSALVTRLVNDPRERLTTIVETESLPLGELLSLAERVA
ncbi:MAG: hypothetical protein AAF485_02695, partial [Chloroflexota bacterium]